MKVAALLVVAMLPGCGLFRAPPVQVDCRLPEPPPALLVVPDPLPALPVDLPARPR